MKKTIKPRPTLPKPSSFAWTIWLLVPLLLLASAGGTWAFFEFVVWNTIPSGLVGKWVVTDGPQEGATFDFHRNGKMIGRINQGGRLAIVDATIRVEGDKIYSTTKHPQTGQEVTVVQSIRTLTANSLVVEDSKGSRMTMSRAD